MGQSKQRRLSGPGGRQLDTAGKAPCAEIPRLATAQDRALGLADTVGLEDITRSANPSCAFRERDLPALGRGRRKL